MKTTKQLFLLTLLFILPMGAAGVEPSADSLRVETCQYAEKDGQPLMLDVYVAATQRSQTSALPPSEGKFRRPVVIFSFGGAWEFGTRKDGRNFLEDFARHGYIAVGIDYRLGIKQFKDGGGRISPETFGQAYANAIRMGVEDLYSATTYIIGQADRWQADTSRIVICGSSAGAINSCVAEYLLANDHPLATAMMPQGFNYAAVISCAGGIWKEGEDDVAWKNRPCPFLAYHGTADQLVAYADQRTGGTGAFGPAHYIPGLCELQVPCLFRSYKGVDHAIALIYNDEDARAEMLSFLTRVLYKNEKISIISEETYYDQAPNLKSVIESMREMGIIE